MLKKPQPKELAIVWSPEAPQTLRLYVTSEAAAEWVEHQAPEFGKLQSCFDQQGEWTLFVDPCYEPAEVKTYLLEGLEELTKFTEWERVQAQVWEWPSQIDGAAFEEIFSDKRGNH
jgi:hypothetical protein